VMHASSQKHAPKKYREKSRDGKADHPQASAQSAQGERARGRSRARSASRRGRSASGRRTPRDCPKTACWDFWDNKPCRAEAEGKKCSFEHKRRPANERNASRGRKDASAKSAECGKCGNNHKTVDCSFSGTCDKCKKQGHMAKLCSAKSDKPRTHKKGMNVYHQRSVFSSIRVRTSR